MKNALSLDELKTRALDVLSYVRSQVLQKHPFTGSVAMNFDLIPIHDPRCDTAMTDGKNIYFDIEFLSKLSQDEREFVLAHEVWHNVMLHFARLESREMNLFNIATDFEVNQLLAADGFVPPALVLFPNKGQFSLPTGLSAEEYYDLLQKQGQNNSGNAGNNSKGASGKGSSSGKPMNGQFDDHFDPNRSYEREAEKYKGDKKDKYGKKEIDPDFKPGEGGAEKKQANIERVREAVVAAAQEIERQRGELPGAIAKIVNDMLKPQVNWREVLAANVTTAIANKTSWNSPNKRFAASGTYLPRHSGESVRLAIGIDTSGSCAGDCSKFLAEIVAIARQFDGYELHVIQCDTEIKDVTEYNEDNILDPETNGIEFKGFGGTRLAPIFDYVKDNELDVDQIIVFTDAGCEDFNESDAPDVPVTWVITGGSNGDNLKFGDKISLKD